MTGTNTFIALTLLNLSGLLPDVYVNIK
ncbi:hypothetical protein SPHINGO8AM_20115 [Sphingomonas sp. 8AM]|nr:hypothetical protein SPHINGO8AM_20115 [Sphingomonas sp. 8AM]